MAKPFVKWIGGKRQLLSVIDANLPSELGNSITRYAEPFVGGGAVLFHLLSKYSFDEVYIGDMNRALISVYEGIRDEPETIIRLLDEYQNKYLSLDGLDAKKEYYLEQRNAYNEASHLTERTAELGAQLIFLNRTGFNGLYRVNRKGFLNVAFGKHEKPMILDEENIKSVHQALQNVTIHLGSYEESNEWIDGNTFVYADPPYRPLTSSANFTSYVSSVFNDDTQRELAEFMKNQSAKGAKFMLSNSDPKNSNEEDNFFDDLYDWANIQRVGARRNVNTDGSKRGKVNEILVTNY